MDDLGRELGWDDVIIKEEMEFEPFPPGIYEFTVQSMERGRFSGSEKMSACNMANLHLLVRDRAGRERHIYDTLYLNTKTEWKLGQFFGAIGQKEKGIPVRPDWGKVTGAGGWAELCINEYTDKSGVIRKNNKIARYLPYKP